LSGAPRPELYDLKNDPEERKNLYNFSVNKAGELAEKLERELLRLSSDRKASGKPATARTTDLEKLKSLGYLNFAPAKPGSAFPDPKEKIDLLRLIQQAKAELENLEKKLGHSPF
jgi:hypothetical protein